MGASGVRSGGVSGGDIIERGDGEKDRRRGEDGGGGDHIKWDRAMKLVHTDFWVGLLAEKTT